jgi:hypothetical protein
MPGLLDYSSRVQSLLDQARSRKQQDSADTETRARTASEEENLRRYQGEVRSMVPGFGGRLTPLAVTAQANMDNARNSQKNAVATASEEENLRRYQGEVRSMVPGFGGRLTPLAVTAQANMDNARNSQKNAVATASEEENLRKVQDERRSAEGVPTQGFNGNWYMRTPQIARQEELDQELKLQRETGRYALQQSNLAKYQQGLRDEELRRKLYLETENAKAADIVRQRQLQDEEDVRQARLRQSDYDFKVSHR